MVSLPRRFVELMEDLGLHDLPAALSTGEPEVSVRLNRDKKPCRFEDPEPVPWCPRGIYLPSRPSFTLDPSFHQGRYYVQEASSMFHGHVVGSIVSMLGSASPLRVLDACAAPGGKTTAVIDALPRGSVVVANEYVPSRAAVLRENVIKWGSPDVIVTRGDTASLSRLKDMFDIVVADVPCSGEGMMRKDPEAVAQWNPGLVRECAERQREIVGNLWRALRPGGFMIYSTCTFNRLENEEIVEHIVNDLGGESVEIPVETSWMITDGLSTDCRCYRFIPGRTRGEGLFVGVIRKPGDAPSEKAPAKERRKKGKGGAAVAVPPEVKGWIREPEKYRFTSASDRISAFPESHLPLLKAVGEVVDVIHEGVTLATVKGRDLIPAHQLAVSTALNPAAFPAVELDREAALRYLRGENPVLPDGTPHGYVAVTSDGVPLGWVKNLGRRCNSLYPQPWRIKIQITNH